jgi:hypothetical protein
VRSNTGTAALDDEGLSINRLAQANDRLIHQRPLTPRSVTHFGGNQQTGAGEVLRMCIVAEASDE